MKKTALSIITLSLLSINAYAYTLKDYTYSSLGFGQSNLIIQNSGEEDSDYSSAMTVSLGFVKQDTHRFSLGFQTGLQSHLEMDGMKFNVNLHKIKGNYDFMIKNLKTNTGVYLGVGLATNIANIKSSEVPDKVKYGIGASGRVGLFQDINSKLQLDVYYERSIDYLKFNDIELKSTDVWMVGLNYKF